jgi:hypothetical protein
MPFGLRTGSPQQPWLGSRTGARWGLAMRPRRSAKGFGWWTLMMSGIRRAQPTITGSVFVSLREALSHPELDGCAGARNDAALMA